MRGILKGDIYSKYEEENQKLRLGGGSWSINIEKLPAGTKVVEYITPVHRYVITLKDAFTHGFTKTLGGERKLVVPIKKWSIGIAIEE